MINLISDTYLPDENRTDIAVKNPFLTAETGDELNPTFKIAWGNQDEHNTIAFTLKSITESAIFFKNCQNREDFLILAIKNLWRKINTTELNEALNFGDIDEAQYNNELDKNAYKYEISINRLQSPEDAILIYDLVDKIGLDIRDFSLSEVSEMFSAEEQQLIFSIKSLSHSLRLNGKTQ